MRANIGATIAMVALLACRATPAAAKTMSPPQLRLNVSARTVFLDRTPRSMIALDIETGKLVDAEQAGQPPRGTSLGSCSIDRNEKTVCPFPDGVLTVVKGPVGAVLEWRSGGGNWRALSRSRVSEVWSASGRLFIANLRSEVATLECFDERRGRAVWMYAYWAWAGGSPPRSNVLEQFIDMVRSGEVGTVLFSGTPQAAVGKPYPVEVVLEGSPPR